ncbi:MAG: glycosyltransferase, partial [Myxococcota bacterium]
VGHNPDMPGVEPAAGWDDLKTKLAAHRFLVHTADPELEDGFNMAVMEALAAGLAVVGNAHPTSPLVHGESALLSNDPWELRRLARRLLEDRALAAQLGAAGQKLVRERFSRLRWVDGMNRALEKATARWHVRDGHG